MEITRSDYMYDSVVMARNSLENRGFFPYPCQVENYLKEHDEDLEIWKNARENKYRVVGRDYWTVTEFEEWQLSYGIVNKVKSIDARSGFRAIDEVRKAEVKMQIEQDNYTKDMAYDLAKSTKKLVQSLG